MDAEVSIEREERSGLTAVELRIVAEFGPSIPRPVVHRCVEEAAADFVSAPIQLYVPLLVERRVRRRLGGWSADARHA